MSLRRLSAVMAALLLPLVGWAAESLAVRLVGDDTGFSAQVTSRIEAAIRRADPEISLDVDHRPSVRRLLIGVGIKGWRVIETGSGEMAALAVMPPRQVFEGNPATGRSISAVFADMPPQRLFNLVQLLAGRKSISVAFVAGPVSQLRIPRLEAAATERGFKIQVEKVEKEAEVGPAVERLAQHASMIMALPDPVAHTASTIPPLLLIAYRAGVPVIGYSDAYLRAGATAALYSTPDQIAEQVVEIVMAYRQGRPLPAPQYLKYFTVGVNIPVAKSLGITTPSAEELESRLKAMRE